MGLKVISNGKWCYGNFETHDILRRFLNPWYLTKVLNPWYLTKVLNPWYFMEVLKSIVFNEDS